MIFYDKIDKNRRAELSSKVDALRADNHLACGTKYHSNKELDFKKMRDNFEKAYHEYQR